MTDSITDPSGKTKFRQINEAFDWVFDAPKKDQVERLKTVAAKNQTVVPFKGRSGPSLVRGGWKGGICS